MGAGRCVLLSNIPENLEVMNGAGFTFKRGDCADLTRMLRLLLGADTLRADAGRAARRRIEDCYLWPEITQEIEVAYQEMLGCKVDGVKSEKLAHSVSA